MYEMKTQRIDDRMFLDQLSWNNFNGLTHLQDQVEAYRTRFGCDPESFHVDQIYRTRANRIWCKAHGIRLSGPSVSAPNPSRLVPNVGKLLREGVGVPAPDAEALDVGSPGAKVSCTSVKCANVDTTPSGSSSNESGTTPSNTGGVQGLW
jgi:hypothetical protein